MFDPPSRTRPGVFVVEERQHGFLIEIKDNSVRAIADLAHAAGALVYVDGVHYTAHVPVHVDALGADFYACSPYKFLGPHCGVLAAKPALLEALRPAKLAPSYNRL